MNGCVVEFEAFQDVGNGFIIKELAAVDVESGLSRVVLFKPPFELTCLDQKSRRVAFWLERNRHGVSWEDGDVDYSELQKTIRDLCTSYSCVFTKGAEKARFLRAFHPNVKDLTTMNAPKYSDDMAVSVSSNSCSVISHFLTDRTDNKYIYKCALRKAQFFVQWVRANRTDGLQTFASLAKRGLIYDGVGVVCKMCGSYVLHNDPSKRNYTYFM